MNRDGAAAALDVARSKLANNEFPSAVRFAKKSIALQDTPEAHAVLKQAEAGGASSSSSSSAGASTSATSTGPSASSTTSRKAPAAKEKEPAAAAGGAHTPAQAALVSRVKKCKVTAYYEILQLERKCGEGEIKKAYRKVRSPLFCSR
jgi:DnaJ family protein B protein 12